jgi:hypothetical protein
MACSAMGSISFRRFAPICFSAQWTWNFLT